MNQAKILIEKLKGLGNIYFESKVTHTGNIKELPWRSVWS